MFTFWSAPRAIAVGCAALALSCSLGDNLGAAERDDDDRAEVAGAPTGAEIPEVGSKKMAIVTAMAGGELVLKDAKLSVPAGALDTDTELTMDVVDGKDKPSPGKMMGPAYDLGPDGTEFKVPVTLELPFPQSPMTKEKAEVVWFDEVEKEWVPLPTAQVKDKSVVAEATHFTLFTVRFVEEEDGVSQTAGACADDFVACGGDLNGTWEFTGACAMLDPDALANSPLGDCEGGSYSADIDITGQVTLQDGRATGTQTSTTTTSIVQPSECLPIGVSCSTLMAEEEGDNCVSNMTETVQDDIDDSYTVEGNTVTFSADAGPSEYCVEGDTLTVRTAEGDAAAVTFTARRIE